MRHLKILGLLAATGALLTILAGSARADTATSDTGDRFTGTIYAEAEGHVVLDNPIFPIKCASVTWGNIISDGPGNPVLATNEFLSFTNCTDNWHVTVASEGTVSFNGTGGYEADVFSTGATVEATRFGISCRYVTNNTTIGTLTGGNPATLHISASIPFHSGSIFCGSSATAWTGAYKVAFPTPLYIDNN